MRTDPTVIDLGTVELGAEHAPSSPEHDNRHQPSPPPLATMPRQLRLQRWWPLLLLTAVLVGSTSAANPVAARLVPLYDLPARHTTAVTLNDEALYVATGVPAGLGIPDPEWTLQAYQLSDGTPRWEVPHQVPERQSAISVHAVDGTPLVASWSLRQPSSGHPPVEVDAATTGYDPATGAAQWRHHGFPTAAGDWLVLNASRYEGNPPRLTRVRTTTVDLATGHAEWRHQLPVRPGPQARQEVVWTVSGDGRYLATMDRDSRLTVQDLRTGEQRTTALDRRWHSASLATSGDGSLLVSTLRERRRTLAVYDLYPPTERWTITDQSSITALTPCGPVLCHHGTDKLAGLDPATGDVRWNGDRGWSDPVVLPAPWPAGHLLVRQPGADRNTRAPAERLVVDAATGQPVLPLGDWLPMEPEHQSHPLPIVYQRGESTHPRGHPDHDPGRLWLGRVDPDLTGVHVLGSVDSARGCHLGARHLACVTTGQRVQVWRVR